MASDPLRPNSARSRPEAPTGDGLSLWLMPEGEVHRELAAWIERLAERFGTEPFAPHLTLVAGISRDVAEVVEAAGRAASGLRPFTVRLEGVFGQDEPFRCLFARAVPDGPLLAAHAALSRELGLEPQADFLPHLSLVYGRLLPEQKLALAHEVGPEVGLRFEAAALHVWATAGVVPEWREAAQLPFGAVDGVGGR